jgi:hypothetical protein
MTDANTFNCTSSPKFYSTLSIGLPTRDAKVALGKLSPAKPIFIYPVPGSHMIESLFIYCFCVKNIKIYFYKIKTII